MTLVHLEGVTARQRHEATAAVFECVNSAGGWTDDTNFFSNLVTAFRISIPGKHLADFEQSLELSGIRLTGKPDNRLPDGELTVLLQLNFVHGEPDLKRLVPPIPG